MEGSAMPPMFPQEKPPQETVSIMFDDKEYNLEITKSNFEYPKNIQEETGIIGYERTIIPRDKLREISTDDYFQREKLSKELLEKLSDGEFFNLARHEMGWHSRKNAQSYVDKFKDQKFILQKIFDVNGIEELQKENNTSSTFSHGVHTNEIKFGLFDKKTLQVIEEHISTSELPKYKEKIAGGDVFLCNTDSGLSEFDKANEAFYDLPEGKNSVNIFSGNTGTESAFFAFDPTEPHLHKYFSDIFELYKNLNKANHTNIVGRDEIFFDLYQKIHYTEMLKPDERVEGQPNRVARILRPIRAEFRTDPMYNSKKSDRWMFEMDGEGLIPVVIGNDNIKQLRWGDAKYATFWTENGLNFLKIIHAKKASEE